MPSSFDDGALRSAMTAYLKAAQALDDASTTGAGDRDLLELAEAKALAGMELRKRMVDLGWTAPASQRSTR